MPEFYAHSAVRHFNDADRLASSEAFDGAGYLIGYAVECAIKTAVEGTRPTAKAPHAHLPDLIEKAKKMLTGRAQQAIFTALKGPTLLDGWSTDLRYDADGAVTEAMFLRWRSEAGRVLAAAGLKRGQV